MDDWVLDAILDPSRAGHPDPTVEGLYFGRVAGISVGVIYALDHEALVVSVLEIGSAPDEA